MEPMPVWRATCGCGLTGYSRASGLAAMIRRYPAGPPVAPHGRC